MHTHHWKSSKSVGSHSILHSHGHLHLHLVHVTCHSGEPSQGCVESTGYGRHPRPCHTCSFTIGVFFTLLGGLVRVGRNLSSSCILPCMFLAGCYFLGKVRARERDGFDRLTSIDCCRISFWSSFTASPLTAALSSPFPSCSDTGACSGTCDGSSAASSAGISGMGSSGDGARASSTGVIGGVSLIAFACNATLFFSSVLKNTLIVVRSDL